MKKLLLPLIMALVGVSGGVGAGLFLKPEPEPEMEVEAAADLDEELGEAEHKRAEPIEIPEEREYAKLNNQFVIPVVKDGAVSAMVVMSLNVEVALGGRSIVFASEPKLRDGFLQVMFDHANIGGFSGNFTSSTNMRPLRSELLRTARDILGDIVVDVLIIDIVRQDS